MNRPLRSVFVSDVHLGTRESQAKRLTAFLKTHESDNLFLVGDVVDGWALKHHWYWDRDHNDLIDTILGIARTGTRVVYVPGNHDEFLRSWRPVLRDVEFHDHYVYYTAVGKRFLIIHGDQFDSGIRLARTGHALYYRARRLVGPTVASWCKEKTESVSHYFSNYHERAREWAVMYDCTGVVCGHVHKAEIVDYPAGCRWGFKYVNDGDWVESCTAVVEDRSGTFSILRG
jgi:UDP-2,3-diacylglucosamine pyrophosphatase LpxH